jgi:hypothetical protein
MPRLEGGCFVTIRLHAYNGTAIQTACTCTPAVSAASAVLGVTQVLSVKAWVRLLYPAALAALMTGWHQGC